MMNEELEDMKEEAIACIRNIGFGGYNRCRAAAALAVISVEIGLAYREIDEGPGNE